ncbi:hypothetical protein [Streptomyces niveus]|uniref:hypothetical protein n=1 Tax=Streptomyces niveus TaxID=193462 RepID=UPI00340E74C9
MEWIKSDGTGQEVLTTAGGAGTFSPDGTQIAFSATDDVDYTHSTYVIDAADGRNLRVLTDQAATPTDWLNR